MTGIYIAAFLQHSAGPVSGFLVQKLGFRTTTIVGALIGCTGIVSSAFVNSLAMAYLTFGFLGGEGDICQVVIKLHPAARRDLSSCSYENRHCNANEMGESCARNDSPSCLGSELIDCCPTPPFGFWGVHTGDELEFFPN